MSRLQKGIQQADREIDNFYRAIAEGAPAKNLTRPIEQRMDRKTELVREQLLTLCLLVNTKATWLHNPESANRRLPVEGINQGFHQNPHGGKELVGSA